MLLATFQLNKDVRSWWKAIWAHLPNAAELEWEGFLEIFQAKYFLERAQEKKAAKLPTADYTAYPLIHSFKILRVEDRVDLLRISPKLVYWLTTSVDLTLSYCRPYWQLVLQELAEQTGRVDLTVKYCRPDSLQSFLSLLGLDPHVLLDRIDEWLKGIAASDEMEAYIATVQSHEREKASVDHTGSLFFRNLLSRLVELTLLSSSVNLTVTFSSEAYWAVWDEFRTCWGRVEELLVAEELWNDHKKLIFFLVTSAATCIDSHLEVDQ
ncbi:hypothetical protein Taro_031692, partial [Colocasia esculenta]|nr:hypothetical protein [Colocasia esculenta]